MSSFNVRPAEADDLAACLALDDSYSTNWVWQVIESRSDLLLSEPGLLGEEQRTVSFRPTRLPRPRLVSGKSETPHRLRAAWQQIDFFAIATSEGSNEVVGYINLFLDRQRELAWLTQVAVAEGWRRQRVGATLLEAAKEWARLAAQRSILTELTTANYPASRFLQSQGFTFCGYNDAFDPAGEMTFFYNYPLAQNR